MTSNQPTSLSVCGRPDTPDITIPFVGPDCQLPDFFDRINHVVGDSLLSLDILFPCGTFMHYTFYNRKVSCPTNDQLPLYEMLHHGKSTARIRYVTDSEYFLLEFDLPNSNRITILIGKDQTAGQALSAVSRKHWIPNEAFLEFQSQKIAPETPLASLNINKGDLLYIRDPSKCIASITSNIDDTISFTLPRDETVYTLQCTGCEKMAHDQKMAHIFLQYFALFSS